MIESVIAVWSRRNLQNINIDMKLVILIKEICERQGLRKNLQPRSLKGEDLGKDGGIFPRSLASGLNFEINIYPCLRC